MNSKRAEALLAKYWEGKTGQEEEKELKRYFSDRRGLVDPDAAYFDYLEKKQTKALSDQFDVDILEQLKESKIEKNGKNIFLRYWYVAASLILIVSISIIFKTEIFRSDAPTQVVQVVQADTFEDPERAFEETKKALLFISSRLNESSEYASQFSKFEQSQKILKQN